MDERKMIAAAVFTVLLFGASTGAAQSLSDAFPTGHANGAVGLAYFHESDFLGLAANPGVVAGFDPWKFATVDARLSILFTSLGVAGRWCHGRPGSWGGVYAGPRIVLPNFDLSLPHLAGSLGYEYRWKQLRFGLDGTLGARGNGANAAEGGSTTSSQLAELVATVGWSFDRR